jgi:hypothetical protein
MILCATTLAVLLLIGGVLDLVWRLRKLCKLFVASATEISIRELYATRVEAARRETENETKEECLATTVAPNVE